ncbi:YbaB/EbfC family nucleoid-associated protein [Frankia gtarii]|uniref:YbaB/EbfC family nucleoid-associated protein n=1 Tax=Frankia gtarii TaxID=2950102 RepID=UPI0021BF734A|nr:YbaB/EbfC family nucleoid-associated protein [Frankia gtarii]
MALFDDNQLEAAMAELARTEEVTERIRRRGEETTYRTTDKNKLLSVTVGGRGELRELTFRGDGYRDLAPAELADLLVKTIERARKEVRRKVMAGVQELMLELPSPVGNLAEVDSAEGLVDELARMFTRNMPDDGGELAPPEGNGVWR